MGGQQDLYSLLIQLHILLLKIDFYTQTVQIPQRTQHIHRIASKTADRLRQDQVNPLLDSYVTFETELVITIYLRVG